MNADPITLTGHLHPGTEEGTPLASSRPRRYLEDNSRVIEPHSRLSLFLSFRDFFPPLGNRPLFRIRGSNRSLDERMRISDLARY